MNALPLRHADRHPGLAPGSTDGPGAKRHHGPRVKPGVTIEEGNVTARMTDKLTDAVTKAWVRLVRARHKVVNAVEADGKDAGVLPMEWYDVLWELERAPEGRRPFELEQRLLFAQYNLSRLIERMVEAGMVRRSPCAEDKRGHVLTITELGRKQRKATWPVYARSVNKHLGDKLTEAEAEKLAALLGKLLAD